MKTNSHKNSTFKYNQSYFVPSANSVLAAFYMCVLGNCPQLRLINRNLPLDVFIITMLSHL